MAQHHHQMLQDHQIIWTIGGKPCPEHGCIVSLRETKERLSRHRAYSSIQFTVSRIRVTETEGQARGSAVGGARLAAKQAWPGRVASLSDGWKRHS